MAEEQLNNLDIFSETIPSKVRDFLNNHPALNQYLPDLRHAIDEYFGADKQLNIDLFIDPEDSDDQSISITVITDLTSEDIFDKLKQFDHGWWFKQPYSLRQYVTITIESQ